LLDFLYGLLEPEEVQRLQAHLAECPACRAALAEAEAHQRLLARAAHVARAVPAFVAPSGSPLEEKSTSPSSEAPASSATEGLTLPMPRRVKKRWRRWAWLATAAAILLAAGRIYWSYEAGLSRHQAELAQAKHDVEAVDARFASVTRTYEEELARLPEQARARQLRLQVSGPTNYNADAPAQIRITTQDGDGRSAKAQLRVALLDAAGNVPLLEKKIETSGETAVTLPAGLKVQPGQDAKLIVKATTDRGGEAKLSEPLTATAPPFDTHVVLSKPAYRPGELLSFRALTLDRFNQKPPQRELSLNFALRDSRNVALQQLQVKTRPDGVSGGEFPLGALPAGAEYTLEVASTGPVSDAQVLPHSSHFLILENDPAFYANFARLNVLANQVNFDRNSYAPGDTVRGYVRPVQNQAAGQAVILNARQSNGQTIPLDGAAPGKPLNTMTDAQGQANFNLKLPRDISPGRPVVEGEIRDGKASARFQQDIPVAYPEVEFFPEGGDLIAGVPNRVYFRSQNAQGAPAAVQGLVVNREGKEVARLQPPPGAPAMPGEGCFVFTPQVGEAYTCQTEVSAQTRKVVPLPPVHRAGIALTVPQSVDREGQPIVALVRSSVPVQGLLVLASCRGTVVDQQFVAAGPKGAEVRLSPVPGTKGVVRVTVYEPRQSELLPRAERLVYRIPAERLVVSCTTAPKDNNALAHRPGEHVKLGINIANEKGERENATVLAAGVDERVLAPGGAEQGPPAFFYLTSDIRDGADVENADFLVSDTPQARAALDLFLGTQGWRRISEAGSGERTGVFSRHNFDDSAASAAQFLASAQQELGQKALRERGALQEEREVSVRAVNALAASLADYQQLPQRGARLAVGVLVLFLLAVGGVLLVIGLVRVVLGRRPTPAFAGAFTSLLLCLVLYGVTAEWRQPTENRAEPGLAMRNDRLVKPLPQTDVPRVNAPDTKASERAAPAGRFLEQQEKERLSLLSENAARGLQARNRSLSEEFLRRAVQEELSKGRRQAMLQSVAPAGQGGMMKKVQEAGQYGGGNMPAPASNPVPPPPGPPAAPATREAKPDGRGAGAASRFADRAPASRAAAAQPSGKAEGAGGPALRDFAYRDTPRRGGLAPDVLLWYPALAAADGSAHIAFDLPAQAATYRLLLYASSPSGRLGTYRAQIEARQAK
jgi:hypothetical protein